MKIIKVTKLSTLKFGQYINSVAKTEEDAIEWAKRHGADTLYRFEAGKLWIINAEKVRNNE